MHVPISWTSKTVPGFRASQWTSHGKWCCAAWDPEVYDWVQIHPVAPKRLPKKRRIRAWADVVEGLPRDTGDTGNRAWAAGDEGGDTGDAGDDVNTGDTGDAGDDVNTGDTGDAGDDVSGGCFKSKIRRW